MFERCYNPNCKEYWYYGSKGVNVDFRWHSLEDFLHDATELVGWNEKEFLEGKLQLDKDLYEDSTKTYSKYTCSWIDSRINRENQRSKQKVIKGIAPNGEEYIFTNQTKFAKENNLIQAHISSVARGERKHHKGWVFTFESDYLTTYSNIPQLTTKKYYSIVKDGKVITINSYYKVRDLVDFEDTFDSFKDLIKTEKIKVERRRKYTYEKLLNR